MNVKRSNKFIFRLFIAITIASCCIENFDTLVAQELKKTKQVSVPMKVMSFNIRYGAARDGENQWKNRSYLVAETIKMFAPDLLGGQEVLKFQAEFLKQVLPNFGFHGVGREDGIAKGEYVPIMYRKERFKLSDSGHFWLSDTPAIAGSKSWDSSLPRMVSWVELNDMRNDGAKLIFLNTHFDHRGPKARLESARLIRKRAEEIMGRGIPFVITGDFNTTEDNQPYQELISGSQGNNVPILDSFRQANRQRSPNESTMSRWEGKREGTRIDWVLHSGEFTTLQSVINYTHEDDRYPSDHYPVQAVLRMKR